MRDHQAMLAIQKIMSATRWDADTFDAIAEVLKTNGYAIEDAPEAPDPTSIPDPCPDCGAQLKDASGGGVKCPKCPYWFCF